jgi:hypothetical protein
MKSHQKTKLLESYEELGPMPAEWGHHHLSQDHSMLIAFVKPFVDAFKASMGDLQKIAVHAVALGTGILSSSLSVIIPQMQADIQSIINKRDRRLDAIEKQYAASYQAVSRTFKAVNIGMIAFMANPLFYLGYDILTQARNPMDTLRMYQDIFGQSNPAVMDVIIDIGNTVKSAANTLAGAELFELTRSTLADGRLSNAIASTRQYGDMRRTARSISADQGEDMMSVVNSIANSKSLRDLERLTDGKFKLSKDYDKLPDEQKQRIEREILGQVSTAAAQQLSEGIKINLERLRRFGMNRQTIIYRNLSSMLTVIESKLQRSAVVPFVAPKKDAEHQKKP